MNSRRRLLQLLGLGSLFATAGTVTLNQARAAKGMRPISPGFVGDEIHEHKPRRWVRKYRVVDYGTYGGVARWSAQPRPPIKQMLAELDTEGWLLTAVAGAYGDQFIFVRDELVEGPEA